MPSYNLILDQNTTVQDIADYFNDVDPGKHIRARKRGDGQIELYVRKDSFKQFFTDKLRAGFLVERDYKEAQNRILEIIDQAEPAAKNLPILKNIKDNFSQHRHDFYANELNQEFKNLSQYLKKQNEAKEVVSSAKDRVQIPSDDKTFEDPECFKEHVRNFTDYSNLNTSFTDTQVENLFNFLRKYTSRREKFSENDVGNNAEAVLIDYEAVKNFGLTWHAAVTQLKKTHEGKIKAPGQPEKFIFDTLYLTKLSREIFMAEKIQQMNNNRLHSIPIQVDLLAEDIENTDADCVVIDPDTAPLVHTRLDTSHADFSSKIISLENTGIFITIKEQPSTKVMINTSNLLKIDYPDDRVIIGNKLDILYEIIFREITDMMPSRMKDQPHAPDETQLINMSFTAHIPILLLSDSEEENQQRKDEILSSFVKATRKMALDYPHLIIKVQIPKGVSLEDIYAAYAQTQ